MLTIQTVTTPQRPLTAREEAAIKLLIPESGQEWLDDMIREARWRDMAEKALQALVSCHPHASPSSDAFNKNIRMACAYADAMTNVFSEEE